MRLAHVARHLSVSSVAHRCFKPRSIVQARPLFGMESLMTGASLGAAVRRLSTYENARKYSPCAPKEAAVLVPLFEDDEGVIKVVLTERSHKLTTHAGEVAFPGGKRDPEDESIQSTALREAKEEMNLDPKDVQVIAQLSPILSRHHLSVTPIVGVIRADVVPSLVPFPAEVASIFTVPLHYFLEEHPRHTYQDAQMGKFIYRIHHFEHEGYDIWGLTGGMLINVAEIAFGKIAEFDVFGAATNYAQLYFDGRQVRIKGSEGESDVCFLPETKPAKRRRSHTQPQPSL